MGRKAGARQEQGTARDFGRKILERAGRATPAVGVPGGHRIALLAVLAVACALQVYYLTVTSGQPVWWDEAEYLLKARSLALGTPDSGFWWARPIAMPLVLSGFYWLDLGEPEIRIAIALISLASVYLLYRIGQTLFGAQVGLIAALLYALLDVNLFFSMRVLTEVPSLALGLLGLHIYLSGTGRRLWLVCPILALATLVRYPVFLFFVFIVFHALFTRGTKALRDKDYGISLMLGLATALPYLLWAFLEHGNPLHMVLASAAQVAPPESWSIRLDILERYLSDILNVLPTMLLPFLAIGALMLAKALWRPTMTADGWNRDSGGKLLLVIWTIVPIAYFGLMVSHFETRYLFMVYPAVILTAALAVAWGCSFLDRFSRLGAIAFAIAVLGIGGFQLLQSSDRLIGDKLHSYEDLKTASLWILENSDPGDTIVTQFKPQVTFYAQRETSSYPETRVGFDALLEDWRPRYVLLTSFERRPAWISSDLFLADYPLYIATRFPEDFPTVLILELRP